MEISFYQRTNEDLTMIEPLYQQIGQAVQKHLQLKKSYQISVTFVRSRTIHQINLQYRQIDRPTDVISFALLDDPDSFAMEADDLGDIFINIDYARKQAKQYGHSYQRELAFLFTHGLLHCLGYDHMDPQEEKEMFALQDAILDPIIPRYEK